MKALLSIALIITLMTSCNNKCDSNCGSTTTRTSTTASIQVPEGVVKAIEYYINGGRLASSEAAKPGFAETATMSWYENGKLQSVPIQTLFDGFDSWQPTEASYNIINCEIAEDVAMVAIDSKFGDAEYTDMFTLVKDGDNWKIVSKVYHEK